MKKVISVVLVCLMAFSIIGCNKSNKIKTYKTGKETTKEKETKEKDKDKSHLQQFFDNVIEKQHEDDKKEITENTENTEYTEYDENTDLAKGPQDYVPEGYEGITFKIDGSRFALPVSFTNLYSGEGFTDFINFISSGYHQYEHIYASEESVDFYDKGTYKTKDKGDYAELWFEAGLSKTGDVFDLDARALRVTVAEYATYPTIEELVRTKEIFSVDTGVGELYMGMELNEFYRQFGSHIMRIYTNVPADGTPVTEYGNKYEIVEFSEGNLNGLIGLEFGGQANEDIDGLFLKSITIREFPIDVQKLADKY
ncbi:MAG TPA: hypothetical protein GXZ43_06690 [Clostridiaceae bacterium]|nr:hypothetical protein [Clostridiaceae bacterium]